MMSNERIQHYQAMKDILLPLGFETNRHDVFYISFHTYLNASQISKKFEVDVSANDPKFVMHDVISKLYAAGYKHGMKDTQNEIKSALGIGE